MTLETIKWFTIGWGAGVLVMGGFTWWLVKKLLRDFHDRSNEEYTKYIKPKYELPK